VLYRVDVKRPRKTKASAISRVKEKEKLSKAQEVVLNIV
jgi:hypothetical protein